VTLTLLLDGFAALLQPLPLAVLFLGVFVGSITGVLPGLGPVGAMAILLPFSFALDAASGILMLAGIFFGARYGGSTTAILMRLPGETTSVVTAIDGYEMTKRGRGGAALAVAAIGSFIAGTLGVLILMLVGPSLSDLALHLSSPEFVVLTVLALLLLVRVMGGSPWMAMAAATLGLALSTIGYDALNGMERLTFGSSDLAQGLDPAPLAAGLFGLAEIFASARGGPTVARVARVALRELLPTKAELRRAVPAMFRGGAIGFIYGLFPGPSGVLATYTSYRVEQRLAREHKAEFGSGAIEGVAGPESSDNGAATAHLVPLLILGLPFTAGTALLLSALLAHDVVPGPLFITKQPDIFWTVIAGLYLANIALLILNLPLVGIFVQVLRVPRDILLSTIIAVVLVGTYAVRNSLFDVVVLIVAGVVGYWFVLVGFPRAPLILGFVLGPFIESSLSQTIALSAGNPAYILSRPISVGMIALGTVTLVISTWLRRRGRVLATAPPEPPRPGQDVR
jgi:putative tricarboxylic transport membrane protein